MKKTYVVQLLIDFIVIVLGFYLFIFPIAQGFNPNAIFYVTMSIYAALELCEYIFDHSRIEPLCIFFTSATAAFSGIFLRYYVPSYVLSITISVWLLAIIIIKIINLEEVYKEKSNLFMIKLSAMSIFTMIGILVSINIYYRISTIGYMLALLYMCYGAFEFICDFFTYLSNNPKFLKE